jgi:tetratricopeptide (TPR) repeat protein
MAAIHPTDGHQSVAAALGRRVEDLSRAHRGRLAALIALSYFDHADPKNCLQWSQIASHSIDEPLVGQVAYLGVLLWRQRAERIGTAFELEKRFTILDDVNRFLETEPMRPFIRSVQEQFEDELAAYGPGLTWPIRWRLLWLLDRHDGRQRQQMIELLQANVATNPADAGQWRLLADLHALNGNPVARAHTLAEAWSAAPGDADIALAWASTCARLDDPQRVEQILQGIDPSKVRHSSEYFFCLAAVAEWKKQFRAALDYYGRATKMCRYRPEYYLRYGRLLMAQGETKAAEKALAWAARIDSSGQLQKQARARHPET